MFAEAGDEEDEVDHVGGHADGTDLLEDEVEDVAEVERSQDRGEAQHDLKCEMRSGLSTLAGLLTWSLAMNLRLRKDKRRKRE